MKTSEQWNQIFEIKSLVFQNDNEIKHCKKEQVIVLYVD